MSGGANIVEQYAGADVPARIELLIKYYPNFIRLVEGYEQSLCLKQISLARKFLRMSPIVWIKPVL